MDLAQFAINKRLISIVITLLILIGGYVSYNNLPRFEDPEFVIRQAQIITPYPGATSMQVAEEVTDVVESALQELQGVKNIDSISTPGLSEITIEYTIAATPGRSELSQRFTQMRNKISDTLNQLPPNAGPSQVFDDFGDVYGLYYSITGDGYDLAEIYEYAKDLQKDLVLVPGVSKAVLRGVPTEVIYVEFTPARLAQLGISSGQIAQLLEGQNSITTSGEVIVEDARIRILPSTSIDSVTTIENLIITDAESGASYRLGDIARVWRGIEDPPGPRILVDGQPAIGIGVSNVLGGNIVDMGNAVKKRVEELAGKRPLGMELRIISDQSVSVKESVDNFVMNVVVALGIVVGTLLIFMGLRSGMLMGGILIVTVAGTLLGMYLGGLDMQRISLGALIIALGMLVDNAIVVVEGTLVRVQRGEDTASAAISVANKNKWPLLAGTIVGILAFSPIGFSPDNTGEYAGSLFWTVLISLFFSWLVAVWLTPYYCVLTFGDMSKNVASAEDSAKEALYLRGIRWLLTWAVKFRWLTVLIVLLIFASALYSFQAVPSGFFPASTRPQFVVDYYLPPETDPRKTAEDLKEISSWIRGQEGVTGTTSAVGGGHIRFMLTYSGESRENSYGQILVDTGNFEVIDGLLQPIRDHLRENYQDSEYKVWKFALGPGGGSKIQARFTGPDPHVLRDLSEQAQVIFAEEGSIGIKNNWRQQVKTILPVINETEARRVGLSSGDVANALQEHFSGSRIGVLREGDELRQIIFRAAKEYRDNPAALKSVMVYSSALGEAIPITQIVERFDMVFTDYKVRRHNRSLAFTAEADPADGINSDALFKRIKPKVEARIEIPPDYELEWRGEAGDSADAQGGLATTMPMGYAAMILVVLFLFNAVRQTVVIWLAVPLSLIGVVYGLVNMNSPLDFMGILAFLSLTGMMVKNAIVLVDETDTQIASGKPRMTAVIDSAVSRVRPVVLGMLTTVLGVAPLLSDPFFKSLAVVIMFGLSFATLLTLVFVPVMYTIFFRIKGAER